MLAKSTLKKIFSFSECPLYYRFANIGEKPCGNCGGSNLVMRFICGDCHVIQNPTNSLQKLNFFDIFNIPQTYTIDKKKLDKDFRRLQMMFHPDKHVTSVGNNSNYAEQYSKHLNEAYKTLKNDVARAVYICELNGQKLDETNKIEDIEFMEQILEKRAQIEMSEDKSEILNIQNENKQIITKILDDINKLFNQKEFSEALLLVERLKYYDRIEEAIQDWEERQIMKQ